MTTSADLLAAARELEIAQNGWDGGEGSEFDDACARLLGGILGHILATIHSDDDEPVTFQDGDWLRSVGFTDRTTTIGYLYLAWRNSLGNTMVSVDEFNHWSINGATVLGYNPTRGQLRLLLRALKIGGE